MLKNNWFLTGTDTDAGKTVVSCALLQTARNAGFRCAGYKPVASGSEMTEDGLRNSDALALWRHTVPPVSYAQINPYTFAEPTSPHIVSELTQTPLEFEVMTDGLHALNQQADWVLTEGAGGWFTPLSATQTYADWAAHVGMPVILVVGVKLGCINHALLTVMAIQQAGLPLAGWVANEVTPPGLRQQAYLATLSNLIPAPCMGVLPHLPDPLNQDLSGYLSLPVSAH
ncbi:dethiobiotin synthase [Morganella morganii]|uniref:dethiobiotin synthase n=1 Tax=Morganella morganii TaxID=582 RepID=UPI000D8E667E|nr:dethiobiotin synthase [Morganella morganii]SPX94521.1 ATP-dependent dethiobiotin synthetase BioD 1 [Morganella morganii]HCT4930910.1 ATP-dependent dethiobiotin synthetase BioD [Morganella morganii]